MAKRSESGGPPLNNPGAPPGPIPQGQPVSPPAQGGGQPQGYRPVQGAQHGHAQAQPVPPGQPLPQAGPVQPGPAYPQAQPVYPQAQPAYPQAQPAYPQARPLPVQPGQAAAAYPQAQPAPAGAMGAARPMLVQPGTAPVRPAEPADEEEDESDLGEKVIRSTPPWLISAVFHMVVLIVLGLMVVANQVRNQIELTVEEVYAEKIGEQLEFDSPLAGLTDSPEIVDPVLTQTNLPPVEDPFAAPPEMDIVADPTHAMSMIDAAVPGLALKGREAGYKKGLLAGYGGTATTEQAVIDGLKWLARNQRKDGSWSLMGPYRDGVPEQNENPVAATAMALLAFQGHGDTHKEGDFKKNVADGWTWLLKQQDADGNFYHEGPFHHRYYTNGQCSIALCELLAMTQDPKFKEPAERAIAHLVKSQGSEGGWRYSPNTDSDVSVTGWIVMALQSAKMAGLEVPPDTFRKVERFLDSVAMEEGTRYPYQKGREATNTMTAEGMLCRQYLGWPRDDPRLLDACDWLTQDTNLVSFNKGRNVYYWYYATQVMHHMEDEYWKKWNAVMRQALPEEQVKSGKEQGSWDPNRPTRDSWSDHGGRLFTTCLSIYMLEVYYRHLPLYNKLYNPLAQPKK